MDIAAIRTYIEDVDTHPEVTSFPYAAIRFLLDRCEELKQANSNLAAAAIDRPPYKAVLLQRIQELEERLGHYGNDE